MLTEISVAEAFLGDADIDHSGRAAEVPEAAIVIVPIWEVLER